MTTDRDTALARYVQQHFVTEPERWQARRAVGESLRSGLQMSPYEAALVAWLLRLHGATHVLEVGSFVGVSALWLASALPPDGTVTTIERDATYATHARATMQDAGETRVECVEADILDYLATCTTRYDALFLDGEKKTYADVLNAALPHLKKGALIIADNTLLFGAMLGEAPRARVTDTQHAAMERFHTTLADTTRFDTTLLPTTEGLTVAVYKA